MSFIGNLVGDLFGGDDAADASRDAAQIQAEAQRDALEYLKEVERLPREIREDVLPQLADFFQLPEQRTQEEQIAAARQSPLYQAILGTQERGEDAILRSAAATGGLRSGNTIEQIGAFGQQLEQNALLQAFNQQQQQDDLNYARNIQGLTGLAGLPSYAPQIAQQTAGIGQTIGQGEIAAGQAQQSAIGQGLNTIIGGAQAAASGGLFSDRRLKKNIQKVGTENGHNIYTWDWAAQAERLGLTGSSRGVMADEVEKVMPEAIKELSGYKTVDYSMIGVKHG